jgi:hypothetical protein
MTTDQDNLESRLRNLPAPPIPASLEAKLLAAIPGARTARPRRWVIAIAATCAVAACIALVLMLNRPDSNARAPQNDVSPQNIMGGGSARNDSTSRETRLCDIIPPLPQSS